MTHEFKSYARRNIMTGLSRLPADHRDLFKRIYSGNDPNADITEVIDSISPDKVNWALRQVKNSIDKIYTPLDVFEKSVQKRLLKSRGVRPQAGSLWKNYDDVIDDVLCDGTTDLSE